MLRCWRYLGWQSRRAAHGLEEQKIAYGDGLRPGGSIARGVFSDEGLRNAVSRTPGVAHNTATVIATEPMQKTLRERRGDDDSDSDHQDDGALQLSLATTRGASWLSALEWDHVSLGSLVGNFVTVVDLIPSVPKMFDYYFPDAPTVLEFFLAHVEIDDGRDTGTHG